MAAQTKIKVRTEDLLAAVKRRREQIVKAHARAVEKHEATQADKQRVIVEALRKALAAAERGKYPSVDERYRRGEYRSTLVIDVGLTKQKEPVLNTGEIDRLIATLEMAADVSLSISADDAAKYLG